jgi:hypothetical protein
MEQLLADSLKSALWIKGPLPERPNVGYRRATQGKPIPNEKGALEAPSSVLLAGSK